MDWLENLLFNSDSIAHIVLLYSIVISLGVLLGRVKIFGVSLGVTFILFVGILMGHFGFNGNLQIINFVQDFGLILFVFCIGLQVGPSFFSSFKKGGISMNIMSIVTILLNIMVMVVLWLCLFDKEDLPMIAGTYTDPPALAYANQVAGNDAPALGYTTVYPLSMFLRIITAQVLILVLG